MAHLLLPSGHTERDRRLAERIAVALRSEELVVCRVQATPRPAPRQPRPAPPSRPVAALTFVWEAVVALGDRASARIAR